MRLRWSATAHRRPILLGAVALALLIGLGTWQLLPSEPEASPEEVVSDFFHAQREGDCERLLEVLSEASWSDDGERSRDEFLEQCPDAIAGYEPSVEPVTATSNDDPGRIEVEALDADSAGIGHLVREDGDWKVETDESYLRIGPPADDAVYGYLDAYADGDCEAITTYVTEEAWSEQGTLERDDFLDRCDAAVARRGSVEARSTATAVSVSHHDTGDALATIINPPGPVLTQPEVSLVKDDLRWRVDGDDGIPHAPPGTYLRLLRYAELQASLVDRPRIDGQTCHDTIDSVTGGGNSFYAGMPTAPRDLDAHLAVSRTFDSCNVAVTLYEFADDETAGAAATRLARASGEQARDERPTPNVDVPGHPTAIGVRTGCDIDYCLDVAVFLAHGRQVIGSYSQFGKLDLAAQLLRAQLELDRR